MYVYLLKMKFFRFWGGYGLPMSLPNSALGDDWEH